MPSLTTALLKICKNEQNKSFFSWKGDRRALIKKIEDILYEKSWGTNEELIAALAPVLVLKALGMDIDGSPHEFYNIDLSGKAFQRFYANIWDALFLSLGSPSQERSFSYAKMTSISQARSRKPYDASDPDSQPAKVLKSMLLAMCTLMEAHLFTQKNIDQLHDVKLNVWITLSGLSAPVLRQDTFDSITSFSEEISNAWVDIKHRTNKWIPGGALPLGADIAQKILLNKNSIIFMSKILGVMTNSDGRVDAILLLLFTREEFLLSVMQVKTENQMKVLKAVENVLPLFKLGRIALPQRVDFFDAWWYFETLNGGDKCGETTETELFKLLCLLVQDREKKGSQAGALRNALRSVWDYMNVKKNENEPDSKTIMSAVLSDILIIVKTNHRSVRSLFLLRDSQSLNVPAFLNFMSAMFQYSGIKDAKKYIDSFSVKLQNLNDALTATPIIFKGAPIRMEIFLPPLVEILLASDNFLNVLDEAFMILETIYSGLNNPSLSEEKVNEIFTYVFNPEKLFSDAEERANSQELSSDDEKQTEASSTSTNRHRFHQPAVSPDNASLSSLKILPNYAG